MIGAVIDLGYCLDLLDTQFLRLVKNSYQSMLSSWQALNLELPANKKAGDSKDLVIRRLDCAVIENLHQQIKTTHLRPFDAVRGVFVEGDPLYPDAGFNEKNHVQICIINPNCIKGFFIPRAVDDHFAIP